MESAFFQSFSKDELSFLLAQSPYILCKKANRADFPILYVTPNAQSLWGYSVSELTDPPRLYSSFVDDSHRKKMEMELAEAIKAGNNAVQLKPYRFQTKAGEWIWLQEDVFIPPVDPKSENLSLISVIQDVSFQHELRSRLLDREEKLHIVIDHSPVAIAILDSDLRFQVVNKSWQRLFNVQWDVTHYHLQDVFPDIDSKWNRIYQKCLSGYAGNSQGEPYLRNDGSIVRIRWQIEPYYNKYGDIIGLFQFIENITEESQALEKERIAQKNLMTILNNLEAAVYVADMDSYEIYYANNYTKKYFGDVEGDLCYKRLHKQSAPCSFCNNQQLVSESGVPTGAINREFYHKVLGKWFSVSDVAIEWPNKKYVRLEIAYDITKLKNTQYFLNQSEIRYRQVFETNQALKLIINQADGKVLNANKAACQFYGFSCKELTKLSFFDLVVENDATVLQDLQRGFLEDSFYIQLTQKTANNQLRDVEIYLGKLDEEKGRTLYAIIHDITDRKLAEQELAIRDQILYAVSQAAQLLLKIENLDQAIPLALDTLGKATGVNCICVFENHVHSEEDVMAKRVFHWRSSVDEEGEEPPQLDRFFYVRDGLRHWLKELFGGGSIYNNIDNFSEEEKEIFLPLHVNSFLIMPIYTSSSWWGFIGFFVKDHKKDWHFYESELLKSAAGILGSAIERNKILDTLKELNNNLEKKVHNQLEENRRKDHMLIAQSRLAGMGEMMGNIAHQWRQPITVLSLLFQDIKESFVAGELNQERLQETEKEVKQLVNHLSQTIDDFRDFYKPSQQKVSFRIFGDSLGRVMSFVRMRLERLGVELNIDMIKDVTILGYPNEYAQVFMNIINNAIDVFQEKTVTNPRVDLSLNQKDQRSRLVIEDNGGGIDGKIIDRVFDPYFTTKEKGTGIGLYMSKMIVEQKMGGSLIVENTSGGAKFIITI